MVFKRFRLVSWVTKAFLNRHGRLIIVGFLVGIVAFFGVFKLLPYLPQPKKTEKIAWVGRYDVNNLPVEVLNYLSIGLTTVTNDGRVAPGLASNWQISDEGKTYTFTLDDDLFWADHTTLKVEDINLHIADVLEEVVDEKTLRLKLKEPFSPFLTIVSQPIFKEDLLGVGPYKLRRIKKQGNLVEKIFLSGPDQNIVFVFYPTQQAAWIGYQLGEVDILPYLVTDFLQEQWQSHVQVEEKIDKQKYLGLFFNTEYSLLNDKNIRQGLAYAIADKSGEGLRATGSISPLSWAYNPEVKLYEFDAQKALEILKDTVKDEKLKISTSQSFLTQAEKIKSSWEEVLGLKVEIEVINFLSPDYQVFLGLQQIPADPDQYLFWHSTRAENITHLKSPKIDKLLEDGRKIADLETRKEKYWDFQKTLSEECPVVFLSHPTTFTYSRQPLTWPLSSFFQKPAN